jgi:hypothetical protein
MGIVRLKLGTSSELDLVIRRGVAASAIGARCKNNREILISRSSSADGRRNCGTATVGAETDDTPCGGGDRIWVEIHERQARRTRGAGGTTARNSVAAGAGNPTRGREWRIWDRARATDLPRAKEAGGGGRPWRGIGGDFAEIPSAHGGGGRGGGRRQEERSRALTSSSIRPREKKRGHPVVDLPGGEEVHPPSCSVILSTR